MTITIFSVVLVACISINFTTSTQANMYLAKNIEALARGEGSGGFVVCYSESVVRTGYTYYDCGTCTKIYNEKGRGNQSKCF